MNQILNPKDIQQHLGCSKDMTIEKRLLDIENFCKYLSIGKTQARKMLKESGCTFSLRLGNRWYADKIKLDQWIDEKTSK